MGCLADVRVDYFRVLCDLAMIMSSLLGSVNAQSFCQRFKYLTDLGVIPEQIISQGRCTGGVNRLTLYRWMSGPPPWYCGLVIARLCV